MKILKERPPIYDAICRSIGKPPDTAIFAYGDTIYNPSGAELSPDIIHHEKVHEKQQAGDPVDWWRKYLRDEDFRLDQELEAYAAQYKFICNNSKDRNHRQRMLHSFGKTLASPMYGGIVDFGQAVNKIFKLSGV